MVLTPHRLWHRILLVFLFGMFCAACVYGIGSYWQWGHDGYMGAAMSQAARNSLRFGVFGQAWQYFGLKPPQPSDFYTNHPMLLHFHLIAAHGLFGFHEWVARLVPLLYSVGIFWLLYLSVRHFYDARAAIFAVLIHALIPQNLIFAHLVSHEQGGIFWSLASLGSYLCWRHHPQKKWFVAILLSLTCAVQYDWPGYYMAFFIWLHLLGSDALRAPRLWPKKSVLLAVILVLLVSVNAAAFFGWIYQLKDGLTEMMHSFRLRSQPIPWDGYLRTQWQWSQDLRGPVVHLLFGAWLLWRVLRLHRGFRNRDLLPFSFLTAQIVQSTLFKQAGSLHSYWTLYLNIAIAIGGAELLSSAVRWAEQKSRIPLWVLSISLGAVIFLSQGPFALRQLRWASSVGHASYVPGYQDQHLEAMWFQHLGKRFGRDVRYLIHPSIYRARVELFYYLDAPIHFVHCLENAKHRPSRKPPTVLLVDKKYIARSEGLETFLENRPYELWQGRFVAVLQEEGAGLQARWQRQRKPKPWWWSWLVNERHSPAHWEQVTRHER